MPLEVTTKLRKPSSVPGGTGARLGEKAFGKKRRGGLAMALVDFILGRATKAFVILSIVLFAAVTYFQVRINENPLDSAFSVAVFITTMISIAFTFYSQSLNEKEKERSIKIVLALFTLTGVGFLIRASMVIPYERAWVVPLSCVVPAVALSSFIVLHRRLGGLEAGK